MIAASSESGFPGEVKTTLDVDHEFSMLGNGAPKVGKLVALGILLVC